MRGVMPRHAQYWFGLAVLAGAVGVGSALQLSHHSDGTRPQSRNGRVQVFWSNGHVKSEITYRDDVYDGESRTYYESGAPYELRHYVNGHEDGAQQSWTETGLLYLNYEVHDGRRYGLVNPSPCNVVGEDGDESQGNGKLRTVPLDRTGLATEGIEPGMVEIGGGEGRVPLRQPAPVRKPRKIRMRRRLRRITRRCRRTTSSPSAARMRSSRFWSTAPAWCSLVSRSARGASAMRCI